MVLMRSMSKRLVVLSDRGPRGLLPKRLGEDATSSAYCCSSNLDNFLSSPARLLIECVEEELFTCRHRQERKAAAF